MHYLERYSTSSIIKESWHHNTMPFYTIVVSETEESDHPKCHQSGDRSLVQATWLDFSARYFYFILLIQSIDSVHV